MDTSIKVEISAKELAELLTASRILTALSAGGVDNWEWYGESLKDYEKEFGELETTVSEVEEKYKKAE